MATQFRRDAKLLTRKSISVEHQERGGDAAACVSTDIYAYPHNVYEIVHYDSYAAALLAQTIYAHILPLSQFQFCAEVHECSHVIPDTFHYVPAIDDWIFNDIDNILCDDHDEHYLMKNFPDYAPPIQILLSCLKWATPPGIKGTRLDIDLKTLFLMTRFGVIRAGADTDFVRFVLSIMSAYRTGNRLNTLDASYAIYTYLHAKCHQTTAGTKAWDIANSQPTNTPTRGQRQVAIDAEDIKDILGGIQFVNSANFDILKGVVEQTGVLKDMVGEVAGQGGKAPPDEEGDDEFYEGTCALYPLEIAELHEDFMTHKTQTIMVDRFEGELGKKKQQAFRDAKHGVERRTRVGRIILPPDVDLAVLADVSSSTSQICTQYMRAVVCLLASIGNEVGVREALGLFNGGYKVLMKFGDQIAKTKIRPYAEGGTVLHNLLAKEVLQWDWKAADKYLVIITDGKITSWDSACLPKLEQLHDRGVTIIVVEIVVDGRRTVGGTVGHKMPKWMIGIASTLENLPGKVMEQVILPTLA